MSQSEQGQFRAASFGNRFSKDSLLPQYCEERTASSAMRATTKYLSQMGGSSSA
jgi:hypothetical protein